MKASNEMEGDNHPLQRSGPQNRSHPRKSSNRIFVHCHECKHETYHDLAHTIEKHVFDASNRPTVHLYELIQCRGCDSASMIHRSDEGSDRSFWTAVYYPPRVSRAVPSWVGEMHGEPGASFAGLFHEIYGAVRGRQFRLAAMGARSVIEEVMKGKVGDHGSFRKTLDELHRAGYVSLLQQDALANIVEVGNGAVHREHQPTEEDLNKLLDVLEGILAAIFVNPRSATEIADGVPPRRGRENPKQISKL